MSCEGGSSTGSARTRMSCEQQGKGGVGCIKLHCVIGACHSFALTNACLAMRAPLRARSYAIAIGVLWGTFALLLAAALVWAAWRHLRARWRRRRGAFSVHLDARQAAALRGAKRGGQDHVSLDLPREPEHQEQQQQQQGEDGDDEVLGEDRSARTGSASSSSSSSSGSSSDPSFLTRLWARRWLRRATLLLRVSLLLADVALDIAVTVWLYSDGDTSAAIACTVFLVLPQAALSAALFASLAPNLFGSRAVAALFAPAMLVLLPVIGPVLAVANVRNPDVPLVFWRWVLAAGSKQTHMA